MEFTQRAMDATPAMKIVGKIARTSIRKNFEAEGRPPPWKALQRALKQGGRTLTKSARLMKSITAAAHSDHVDVGTNVVYARIHERPSFVGG